MRAEAKFWLIVEMPTAHMDHHADRELEAEGQLVARTLREALLEAVEEAPKQVAEELLLEVGDDLRRVGKEPHRHHADRAPAGLCPRLEDRTQECVEQRLHLDGAVPGLGDASGEERETPLVDGIDVRVQCGGEERLLGAEVVVGRGDAGSRGLGQRPERCAGQRPAGRMPTCPSSWPVEPVNRSA